MGYLCKRLESGSVWYVVHKYAPKETSLPQMYEPFAHRFIG